MEKLDESPKSLTKRNLESYLDHWNTVRYFFGPLFTKHRPRLRIEKKQDKMPDAILGQRQTQSQRQADGRTVKFREKLTKQVER